MKTIRAFAALVFSAKTKTWIVVALMMLAVTNAFARVQIGDIGYLKSSPGGEVVVVFKTQDGLFNALKLVDAGAEMSPILQFVACIVPHNTKVVIITGQITGAFWSGADRTADVLVATGPNAGCKGVVPEKQVEP